MAPNPTTTKFSSLNILSTGLDSFMRGLGINSHLSNAFAPSMLSNNTRTPSPTETKDEGALDRVYVDGVGREDTSKYNDAIRVVKDSERLAATDQVEAIRRLDTGFIKLATFVQGEFTKIRTSVKDHATNINKLADQNLQLQRRQRALDDQIKFLSSQQRGPGGKNNDFELENLKKRLATLEARPAGGGGVGAGGGGPGLGTMPWWRRTPPTATAPKTPGAKPGAKGPWGTMGRLATTLTMGAVIAAPLAMLQTGDELAIDTTSKITKEAVAKYGRATVTAARRKFKPWYLGPVGESYYDPDRTNNSNDMEWCAQLLASQATPPATVRGPSWQRQGEPSAQNMDRKTFNKWLQQSQTGVAPGYGFSSAHGSRLGNPFTSGAGMPSAGGFGGNRTFTPNATGGRSGGGGGSNATGGARSGSGGSRSLNEQPTPWDYSMNQASTTFNGKVIEGGDPRLATIRSSFAQELADKPDLKRQLIASVDAEDPRGAQVYLQEVFNRAASRGDSLEKTLNLQHGRDRGGYYPAKTIRQVERAQYSAEALKKYDKELNYVLGGGHHSPEGIDTTYVTGNASDDVGVGKLLYTNPRSKERYGLEDSDATSWPNKIRNTRVNTNATGGAPSGLGQTHPNPARPYPSGQGVGALMNQLTGGANAPTATQTTPIDGVGGRGVTTIGMKTPWITAEQAGVKPDFPIAGNVNWRMMKPEYLARLNAAYKDMPEGEKKGFIMNSGYRPATRAEARNLGMSESSSQEDIWERSGHGTRFAAAPPGRSRHGTAEAGDFSKTDWLRANQLRYGLKDIGASFDYPHIQQNNDDKRRWFNPDGTLTPAGKVEQATQQNKPPQQPQGTPTATTSGRPLLMTGPNGPPPGYVAPATAKEPPSASPPPATAVKKSDDRFASGEQGAPGLGSAYGFVRNPDLITRYGASKIEDRIYSSESEQAKKFGYSTAQMEEKGIWGIKTMRNVDKGWFGSESKPHIVYNEPGMATFAKDFNEPATTAQSLTHEIAHVGADAIAYGTNRKEIHKQFPEIQRLASSGHSFEELRNRIADEKNIMQHIENTGTTSAGMIHLLAAKRQKIQEMAESIAQKEGKTPAEVIQRVKDYHAVIENEIRKDDVFMQSQKGISGDGVRSSMSVGTKGDQTAPFVSRLSGRSAGTIIGGPPEPVGATPVAPTVVQPIPQPASGGAISGKAIVYNPEMETTRIPGAGVAATVDKPTPTPGIGSRRTGRPTMQNFPDATDVTQPTSGKASLVTEHIPGKAPTDGESEGEPQGKGDSSGDDGNEGSKPAEGGGGDNNGGYGPINTGGNSATDFGSSPGSDGYGNGKESPDNNGGLCAI